MHNDARHFSAMVPSASHPVHFAYRVVHSNMHPRHCVDEFVIVEDGEKASVGDDVIVVMIDGTTITWRLDAVSDTEITVHGYNPPLTTTIQRRLIREIHPILWAVKGIYDTTTGTVL